MLRTLHIAPERVSVPVKADFSDVAVARGYTTTVQVKLEEIKGSYVALYNLQMAAALMMVLVPLPFFLLLGKYFIRGILAGAL